MPRVTDRLSKTVIYLYSDEDKARAGAGAGGSGFLVGQPTALSTDAVFLWAVSNWHTAHVGRPVIRTAGRSEHRVIPRREDDWVRHPEGDDLVATPIGFGPRDDRDYERGYVPRDWFVEPDDFIRARPRVEGRAIEPRLHPFGSGDETVTVGRFLGYQGLEENQPVARFGNLSVGKSVPIDHKATGLEQESFLVEARSLNGYSGSPVFIYRVGAGWGGYQPEITEPRFLGIDWGHLTASSERMKDYTVSYGGPDQPDPVRYNSGVMTVIPAWRVAALLDSDEAVEIQKREEGKRSTSVESAVELD